MKSSHKHVACNMPAIELGLAVFEQGGDFADGIIAFSGTSLGAVEFVSFDKKVVSALKTQRKKAHLLGQK